MDNFKQPYFAINPSDFWRRWHISLSTWLRDYLYIPLGGNRFGLRRMYFALATTMIIGGFWHGASWTFVLWGGYHGVLLIAHRVLTKNSTNLILPSSWKFNIPRMIKTIMFFQLTAIGWLLFRAENWHNLTNLLNRFFCTKDWFDSSEINIELLLVFGLTMFIIDLINERKTKLFARFPTWLNIANYGLAAMSVVVFSPIELSSFIYFQF